MTSIFLRIDVNNNFEGQRLTKKSYVSTFHSALLVAKINT